MQHSARLHSSVPAPSLLACARALCSSSGAPPAAWSQPSLADRSDGSGIDWGSHVTEVYCEGHTQYRAEVESYTKLARLAGLLQCIARLRSPLFERTLPEVLELVMGAWQEAGGAGQSPLGRETSLEEKMDEDHVGFPYCLRAVAVWWMGAVVCL